MPNSDPRCESLACKVFTTNGNTLQLNNMAVCKQEISWDWWRATKTSNTLHLLNNKNPP